MRQQALAFESPAKSSPDDDFLLVRFVVPLHLENRANMQIGNSQRAAIIRSREHREHHRLGFEHTRDALALAGLRAVDVVPLIVRIIRVSAGKLDDDNVIGCAKWLRDGIAEALGIDDGGRFVQWRYGQLRGPKGTHSVIVRLEHRRSWR
jgi:hypothetical protein